MRPVHLLPLLALLGLPSPTQAQTTLEEIFEKFKPNHRIWHLEASVDREGHAFQQDKSLDGRKSSLYERDVSEAMKLHACGQAGRWAVTSVNWTYKDLEHSLKEKIDASTQCLPPPGSPRRAPKDIRKPCNHSIHEWQRSTTPFGDQDPKTIATQSSAGIIEMPGSGKAVVMVRAVLYLDHESSDVDTLMRVCEGDEVRKETTTTTCARGCPMKTSPGQPSENGSQSTSQQFPPLFTYSGFVDEIAFDSKTSGTLSNSLDLTKDKKKPTEEGAYQEIHTATWTLEPVDPCEQVRSKIEQDLAWAEAYMDEAVRKQAGGDYRNMDDLTTRWMQDRYGKPPSGDSSGSEVKTDLSVGSDCVLPRKKKEDFEEQQRYRCQPQIITSTLVEHEQHHVQQCIWMKKTGLQMTTALFGDNEAGAYLQGVRRMLGWYERNCYKEIDALRRRMAAINAKFTAH